MPESIDMQVPFQESLRMANVSKGVIAVKPYWHDTKRDFEQWDLLNLLDLFKGQL